MIGRTRTDEEDRRSGLRLDGRHGLPLPVCGGRPALDGSDLDESDLSVDVEQKPPVADAATKCCALTLKPLDIAGERIGLHLFDRSL
jgi:hypothetical protein